MKRSLNYFKISFAGMLNIITFASRFGRKRGKMKDWE